MLPSWLTEKPHCPASLRYHLVRASPTSSYEFDFVEGGHPCPGHPAIAAVYGVQQTYLSYCDGSARSALAALDDLAAHVSENGPFDAIMGFSMGSLMAATLLLRPHEVTADRPEWAAARAMVRSAVFMCGIRPLASIELQQEMMEKLRGQDVGLHGRYNHINVPTVHIWSPSDPEILGESEALMKMCDKDKRVEILHTAGHAVPSDSVEAEAAAAKIHKMLVNVQPRDFSRRSQLPRS
ncbi:hypothetical protein DL769_001708 [Monosporascus sp. CRB-8-3]|nr:hypothetical protein DL769_001708 [Monosporascus sp. CRB-8-3]